MNNHSGENPIPIALRLTQLRRAVRHYLQKCERTLKKQQEELAQTKDAELFGQIADSLGAHPELYPRGTTRVTIENVHTQMPHEVVLNPAFDAFENAELLYKKARRGKRGFEVAEAKVAASIDAIEAGSVFVGRCDSLEKDFAENHDILAELDSCENEFGSIGSSKQSHVRPALKSSEPASPYRHYSIDGWDIYIGKTDTQNDELSTRFARGWDLWLHVAAHAGSHVVVRREKNGPDVPESVLKKVAAMTVWFSKARHTSYAEVHYCDARFVHKRRKSPAGQVMLDRYSTIRVSPMDPQDIVRSSQSQAH